MTDQELMKQAEGQQTDPERGAFQIGDSVDVHVRIVEGEKERIQIFSGTVIAKKGGGQRASFTVRRLVGAQGVERLFPLHSPSIKKIEVKRRGRVRRAKLYYLRDRVGKATRVSEKRRLTLAGHGAVPEEARIEAVKPRAASPPDTSGEGAPDQTGE